MYTKDSSGVLLGFIALAFAVVSSGCTTTLRNKQLEQVAKDWSLVVRASQVIPVYPLTEDLQPGDVLLVSTPVEEQVSQYKEKGFLALDQLLVRLNPSSNDYKAFYESRYGVDGPASPPGKWQATGPDGNTRWNMAPHVAFPSYQFSVDTGLGVNLAIPVQGVPFALGLMNSGKASGTITIADAYTFGLDTYRIESMVRQWAADHKSLLRNYEPHDGMNQYLRVVSRVYVTGRVNVTVRNDDASGIGSAAGAERPLSLMGIKEGAPSENYSATLKEISTFAQSQLPGAAINIATATSRYITLSEAFVRPLVIGYVGFDMPILKGGGIGAPISTLAQLTGVPVIPSSSSSVAQVYRLAALSQMYQALKTMGGDQANQIRTKLDALAQLLPEYYPFTLYTNKSASEIQKNSMVVSGTRINGNNFQAVLNFLSNADHTVKTLEDYPQTKTDPGLSENLRLAKRAYEEVSERISLEPALTEAVDFVFFGN